MTDNWIHDERDVISMKRQLELIDHLEKIATSDSEVGRLYRRSTGGQSIEADEVREDIKSALRMGIVRLGWLAVVDDLQLVIAAASLVAPGQPALRPRIDAHLLALSGQERAGPEL